MVVLLGRLTPIVRFLTGGGVLSGLACPSSGFVRCPARSPIRNRLGRNETTTERNRQAVLTVNDSSSTLNHAFFDVAKPPNNRAV
jgi:hypothetical protein